MRGEAEAVDEVLAGDYQLMGTWVVNGYSIEQELVCVLQCGSRLLPSGLILILKDSDGELVVALVNKHCKLVRDCISRVKSAKHKDAVLVDLL